MTFEFVLRGPGAVMRRQESFDYTVGDLRQWITEALSKKDAHFTMYFREIELVDDDMGLYPLLKHEYGELLRTVDVTVHDRPVAVPVAEAPDAGGGVAAAAVAVAPAAVAPAAVAPVAADGDDDDDDDGSSDSDDDDDDDDDGSSDSDDDGE